MVKPITVLAALSLLTLNVGAQVARPLSAPPAPIVSGGSLLQVGGALMLVLAAVAAVAWLLKRLNPHQIAQGGALRVISATAVGQRERVVLVEVDGTWLVVGVAPGHVSALHTMPRPATQARQAQPAQGGAGFSGWLNQTLERNRHA